MGLQTDPHPEGACAGLWPGPTGRGRRPPAGAADGGLCMSAASLCFKCCSHLLIAFPFFHCATFSLFLPPFLFMQISFFASLLPRPLHQSGCPASLSPAVGLSSSWPSLCLLASCLRAGHTQCFLLYRSSSFQCKINTV